VQEFAGEAVGERFEHRRRIVAAGQQAAGAFELGLLERLAAGMQLTDRRYRLARLTSIA
jgi:hypothetical protein